MIIDHSKQLAELVPFMGRGATEADAKLFLEALIEAGFEGKDSVQIAPEVWARVMEKALPVWLP